MNLRENKALIGLAIVVIASGCTGPSNGGESSSSSVTISQTEGVVIDQFTAYPSEVPELTPVQLEMRLVNKGGVDATDVTWDIGNIPLKGSRNWVLDSELRSDFRIPSADAETGTEAGRAVLQPTLTAPNLDQGSSIPYTISSRVEYNYTTSGNTDIVLMSREEARSSGASKSDVSLDNSGGPIQLSTTTRSPIIYYRSQSDTNVQNSRFCVTAENVGSGETVDGGIELAVQTSGTLKVGVSPDGGRTEAQAEGANADPQWTNNARTTVDFTAGRTEARNCFYLNIPDREQVSNKLTLPVTVEASYRYKVEDSTQVTVNGREGGSDNTDSSVGGGSTNSEVQDGGYAWKSPSSLESKYSGNTLTQKKKSLASAKESFDPDNYCTAGTTTSTQKSDYCREVG